MWACLIVFASPYIEIGLEFGFNWNSATGAVPRETVTNLLRLSVLPKALAIVSVTV